MIQPVPRYLMLVFILIAAVMLTGLAVYFADLLSWQGAQPRSAYVVSQDQKRTEQLAIVAKTIGMDFTSTGRFPVAYSSLIHPFSVCENILSGFVAGMPAMVFDYSYTEADGEELASFVDLRQTVAAFQLGQSRHPDLLLITDNIFDVAAERLRTGYGSEVVGRHRLVAPDLRSAARLISTEIRQMLLCGLLLNDELQSGWLLAYRPADRHWLITDARVPVDHIPDFLNEVAGIAALFHSAIEREDWLPKLP